jgi:hypothetical protein
VADLGQPDGYFQMGAIKFTSGANTGLTRTVKSYTGGTIHPTKAFPYRSPPATPSPSRPGATSCKMAIA